MLGWVLNRQLLVLLVAVSTLALTVLLYIFVPKGFFPIQDTGIIQGISEAPQSISFSAMTTRQQALVSEILRDPAVDNVSSFIGIDGTNLTLNSGRIQINLKPHEVRKETASQIIQRLQTKLADIPGIYLYMQPVQDLTIESRISRTQYQFTLKDINAQRLSLWVPKLLEKLNQQPQLVDVASDMQDKGLQAYINIDREAAGRLGITEAAIDNALYSAFGQRLISTIYRQSNLYRVVLEVKPEFQRGLESLQGLYITSSSGTQVPLSAIASIEERSMSLVINHLEQFPATTISFNLRPDVSLGEAVDLIQKVERDIDMPASIETEFEGAASAFRASLDNQVFLILAAIVTHLLSLLFRSWRAL